MADTKKKSRKKTAVMKKGRTRGVPMNEHCPDFAHDLWRLAVDQARIRQPIEERWKLDTYQYYGKYDPETRERLDENKSRSKLFVNLTRPKTRVMRARLIDILFPGDEANWDIEPTPNPRIEKMQSEFPDVAKTPLNAGEADNARALRDEAAKRSGAMKRLMSDQLVECNYAEIGRKVIDQACKLGSGVSKGPFADWRMKDEWGKSKKNGVWTPSRSQDRRPAFEFVNLWNFYPEMDAWEPSDIEFAFERHRMGKKKLAELAKRPDFNEKSIKAVLAMNPNAGDESEFSEHVQDLRLIDNSFQDSGEYSRYTVMEYHGPVSLDSAEAICKALEMGELLDAQFADEDPLESVEAVVWFCQNTILKFGLSPLELNTNSYSVFRLDPSEASIFGFGMPAIIRDPQSAVNAGFRMMMDNAGLSGMPMFIVDRDMVEPEDGEWVIAPGKIWLKTGAGEGPGIEVVNIEGRSEQLIQVVAMAKKHADDEANLPLVAQGDPGTGARQTAHGMTLLVNAVNIIFRNAARSFDSDFTIPNMLKLYEYNMLYADSESVKGDMRCKARGSSVLLVREVLAQNLMLFLNLATTNPLVLEQVKVPKIIRKLLQSLQIDAEEIAHSQAELAQMKQDREEAGPDIDPAIQAKIQAAELSSKTQIQLAATKMETEILRMANAREISIEKVTADLQKATMQIAGKRELMVAEIGAKEKWGEGI